MDCIFSSICISITSLLYQVLGLPLASLLKANILTNSFPCQSLSVSPVLFLGSSSATCLVLLLNWDGQMQSGQGSRGWSEVGDARVHDCQVGNVLVKVGSGVRLPPHPGR